jgi:hypothetical protein
MVGILRYLVIGYQIPGNGLSVVGTKEFCGRMPELPCLIRLFFVQFIFELSISLAKKTMEFRLVPYTIEIERLSRREDDDLL